MHRFVSILLVSLYLTSVTELREATKVGVLFEHFSDHRAANPDMNFFDFLSLHYFSGHLPDNDYKDDMQLPFKSHDSNAFSFTLAVPPAPPLEVKTSQQVRTPNLNNFFYLEHHILADGTPFWQPPELI